MPRGSEYLDFNLTEGDFYRVSDFGLYAVPCNPGQSHAARAFIPEDTCFERRTSKEETSRKQEATRSKGIATRDSWHRYERSILTSILRLPSASFGFLRLSNLQGDGCTTPVRSSLFVIALAGDYDIMVALPKRGRW